MKKVTFSFLLFVILTTQMGCGLFFEKEIIDDGRNIRFVFDEGLNEDPRFRLSKDKSGFYTMNLPKEGQNIQRISVKLLDGSAVVYSKCCGRRQRVKWSNNLYWWALEGETIANITKTYFNPFTGELQYSNFPPLINWKDELASTINPSLLTDEFTGRGSTVIAPIGKMRGDKMIVYVRYTHEIAKWTEGSSFYTSIGDKEIMDSIKIILK